MCAHNMCANEIYKSIYIEYILMIFRNELVPYKLSFSCID